MNCWICGNDVNITGKVTCSQPCHEKLVELLESKFGKFKKIVRMTTGEAFKVPTRDIIEKGIKEQELDKYPKWEE